MLIKKKGKKKANARVIPHAFLPFKKSWYKS